MAGLLLYTEDPKKCDIPEEERIQAAKGLVESYTDWANGHVYEWMIEDEDGDTIESLSGIYGSDYAEESLKEALAGMEPGELEYADGNVLLDSLPEDAWEKAEAA